MTWMLTATGAQFDLELADPLSISSLDIAHGLSLINRFTGHTLRPYSVAEHSLLVVEIMQRELAVHEPEALLAGLLHDAHEVYVGDVSTPLKMLLGDAWTRVERRIEAQVRQRFGVHRASIEWHDQIKTADLIALATERRDLLPPTGPEWDSLQRVQPAHWISLHSRAGLAWDDWRTAWLDAFAVYHGSAAELYGAAA